MFGTDLGVVNPKKRRHINVSRKPPPTRSISHEYHSAPVHIYAPPSTPSHVSSPAASPAQPKTQARSFPVQEALDALIPGPSTKDIAHVASVLGVQPKSLASPSSIVQEAVHGINQIAKDATSVTKLPEKRVHSVLGRKTLGTPTVAQLLRAAQKGQVRVNQRGKATVPATRKAARNLAQAKKRAARSNQIIGPLTPPQRVFAEHLAHYTGLSPRVTAAWTLREGGNSFGDYNYLNIGHTNSGPNLAARNPAFSTPEGAAKATADFLKQTPGAPKAGAGIPEILPRAVGKPPKVQAQVIANSGWAVPGGPSYEGPLQKLITEIGVKPADQGAIRQLALAKAQAKRFGIPTRPTPYNGDVEPGQQPGTVLVRADAKGMVQWAQSALGTVEGSPKQARWAAAAGVPASAPWCSVFIAAGLRRRGITPPPDPAYSGSWLQWSGGRHIGSINKAKPGDLLVFDWGDGGITDHVALYTGNGQMIGGNQNNKVSQEAVPTSNIVGIVRPLYQGGKVPVREAAPLPGGAVSGVGGAGVGAVVGSPVSPGGSGVQAPRATPQLASIPISSLLAAGAPLPTAYQQFQLGEAPSEEGGGSLDIINQILRRKRL